MVTRYLTRDAGHNPIKQITGFVFSMAALYLLVCLSTYSQADPSLNRSTHTSVVNAGGYAGAMLADASLQVLGLASALLVIVPLSWGWKLLIGREVTYLWLRASLLLLASVLLSALLSPIEPFISWPIESGFGGSIGALLHDHIPRLFRNPLFAVFLLAATVFTTAQAFGMTLEEWRSIGRLTWQGCVMVYALAERLLPRQWRREEEEEEYEEYEDEEYEEESRWRQILHSITSRLMFWRIDDDDEEEEEEEDDEEEDFLDEDSAPRRRKAKKPSRSTLQPSLALPRGDYALPPLGILSPPPKSRKSGMNEAALQQNARLLENAFREFGVNGQITQVHPGPVVTLYELEPAPGIKSSRVIGLADDIARSMSAVSARIAVIPGRNAIGIELPNATREMVYLREMMEHEQFESDESKLPLALGKDIGGAPVIVDLSRMPHLLVAGTTGSGKSVAINTMILSLAYRLTPEECRFIMIDPKMLELSIYDGIPHLLTPVVTEPGKAVVALKWTVREMENRYRLMANLSVRNIENYNKAIREAKARGATLTRRVQTGFNPETGNPIIEEAPLDMMELPYIVVIVDEMADLMITSGKEIEASVQRLAQMARAAGIHIIMATQRPSVDVITGVIKANFPTRISFQVITKVDSRTILGEQGAEQLLGQGDMLYMAGGGRITRVHGPFVSDKEVEAVVAHLKEQGEPTYIEDVTRDDDTGDALGGAEGGGERDELYDRAVSIVARDRKASTSYIQRQLKIGYNRAADLIDRMEKEGVVSPANHVGKREVLVREEA